MDVGLGALDVVVQVVPEQMNEVDGVVARVFVGVAREQHKGDVADAVADSGVRAFEAPRRIPAEEDLRCGGTRATTLFELLEKLEKL